MSKPELLVVDDEEGNVNLLRRTFVRDYRVHAARSGDEALAVLRDRPQIAVILTDQRMPGMVGTELLRRSLDTHPKSIRIVLTGYMDLQDLIGAINEGRVWKYVVKPWNEDDLRQSVKDAVDWFELQLENQRLIGRLQEQVAREEKIRRTFQRYVPESVVNQALALEEHQLLGGEEREISVLFCDIRGFTASVEHRSPRDVVAQLNEYFSAMADVVERHHGVVDKYIGDCIMAVWGAPTSDTDHAQNAARAALEMRARIATLNTAWTARGIAPLEVGFGIESGRVIAGNIGCATKMNYTVVGDPVNVAAYLEGLTRRAPGEILIGGATHDLLAGRIATEPFGNEQFKGRTGTVRVFRLT